MFQGVSRQCEHAWYPSDEVRALSLPWYKDTGGHLFFTLLRPLIMFCAVWDMLQGFPDYYALVGVEVSKQAGAAGYQGALTETLEERYKQVSAVPSSAVAFCCVVLCISRKVDCCT